MVKESKYIVIDNPKQELQMSVEVEKRVRARQTHALERHRRESMMTRAKMKTQEEREQEAKIQADIAKKLGIYDEYQELMALKEKKSTRWKEARTKYGPEREE